MSLPVLHLTGTPYEQGLQHGQVLKEQIAHNLAVYFDRFEREVGLPRAEVLARAARYLKAISSQSRDYFAGLRGIADATRFNLHDLAALNVRYEILYYQLGANAMADGCTAFAVAPGASASGRLLLGQNWDWIPQVQGALVHTVEPDGLETLSFTEAGIFSGKIGLNSVGLGLAINGVTSTSDDWSRLSKPFHVRCYEILRARDVAAAVDVVAKAERACSTNFLIAQAPDHVVNVEAAPESVRMLGCDGGCLVHTNHFLDPGALGVAEPPTTWRPRSLHRLERMSALLQAARPLTIEHLQSCLRDHDRHPYSICRHESPPDPPEQHYITVTSIIIDLDAREIYLTDGPPCASDYEKVALA
jgi:isopenicillin-N N-acyltransferase like protein